MIKLIGLKQLQMNTKRIREEVSKGVRFVVVYRSKPLFEIKPLSSDTSFTADLKATDLYTNEFLKRMEKAEEDIKKGKVKTYTTSKSFLKSLS